LFVVSQPVREASKKTWIAPPPEGDAVVMGVVVDLHGRGVVQADGYLAAGAHGDRVVPDDGRAAVLFHRNA
jgi:hypothetical protein